jgi:hypothetical protein
MPEPTSEQIIIKAWLGGSQTPQQIDQTRDRVRRAAGEYYRNDHPWQPYVVDEVIEKGIDDGHIHTFTAHDPGENY